MTAENLIQVILKKCQIYFRDDLISKETIMREYLTFISNSLVSKENTVNFTFHTGSVCFDAITIVAAALGCLSYNMATNEEIISMLETDQIVIFKGKRWRWKGLVNDPIGKTNKKYIMLEQDGKGKNGKGSTYLPYDTNKHLIKPYYGESLVTDGRGVRKNKCVREKFLAYIFNCDITEIPTEIDVSVVIVSEKMYFYELCKQITISYDNGKKIGILDVVPAAYYAESGEEYQYGKNPLKTEPVLKVTGKISEARELVLDRNANEVVGLVVTKGIRIDSNETELPDLIRRKILRFALIGSPIRNGLNEQVLDQYDDVSVFACTKKYFEMNPQCIVNDNSITRELHRQITNISSNEIITNVSYIGWNKEGYKKLLHLIDLIKQSRWDELYRDDFVGIAYGLIKLFNTVPFTMKQLEKYIERNDLQRNIVSPIKKIEKLKELSVSADGARKLCDEVIKLLENQYEDMYDSCPKGEGIFRYIRGNQTKKIALVVSKAYYVDVLIELYPNYFRYGGVHCVTANKLNQDINYDVIIVAGNIYGAKFDPLYCTSASKIMVYLLESEHTYYKYRVQQKKKNVQSINKKAKLVNSVYVDKEKEQDSEIITKEEVKQEISIEKYIEEVRESSLQRFLETGGTSKGSIAAEVEYIGRFTTGEYILFSKYYSAVVFDSVKGKIIEKKPNELQSSDVLIFLKHNDYTKNIVDYIFEQLLSSGRLSHDDVEDYRRSQHWKELLRGYKVENDLTYNDLAEKLSAVGKKVEPVTVRQWIVEDSHVVAPQKKEVFEYIGKLTMDEEFYENRDIYYESCKKIRHLRRNILELISKAINDKFNNTYNSNDSILKVIYDNIDELSESLELEEISELKEHKEINANLVNIPIMEMEV